MLGNHDHFWMGGLPVGAYQGYFTNTAVVRLGDNYMGTIDGSTPYGDVINVGSVTNFVVGGITNSPRVVADPDRRPLTTSSWMREFFNTTSKPIGHGFSEANVTSGFACYSFQPRTNLPLKVIVLDDTMSDADYVAGGQGSLDTNRFRWLVQELDQGQAQGQLMIIATHVPLELIGPESPVPLTNLLATLHTYPNLLLWMCGHTHQNNIVPQPSPDPAHPEYGFWEVQTASLRDFPQEFRTFELLRNTDNSISILVTDIDPEVGAGSPAAVSRGYAVGAARAFMAPCTSFADTNSYVRNAELLKLLTPAMQTKLAGLGGPLGHQVAIDRVGDGVVLSFLGQLQSADTPLGPWSHVTDISPYAAPAGTAVKFYRAVE